MMSDAYADLRNLPLQAVIWWLGIRTSWKTRKEDTEFYGTCPLHEAKRNTTSFSFDQEGRFHCFSCGAKGRGCLDFVMAYRKVGFKEAVEILKPFNVQKDWVGPAAKKPAIKLLQEQPTENKPFASTYEKYKVESPWLKARGFSRETLDRYEVFQYENPKRKSVYSGSVMLKIRRWSDSEPVAYLVRNIGEVTAENPKYRFPPKFQKSLEVFGAHQIRLSAGSALPLRVVYVVESPFACMKFAQLSLAAVSLFGWSASPEQAAIIAQIGKGCYFLPDRNKWTEAQATAGLLAKHLWTKMPSLPDGIDDPEQMDGEMIRSLA